MPGREGDECGRSWGQSTQCHKEEDCGCNFVRDVTVFGENKEIV